MNNWFKTVFGTGPATSGAGLGVIGLLIASTFINDSDLAKKLEKTAVLLGGGGLVIAADSNRIKKDE